MVRIGLTGGIASGKSVVADELARLGAVVIDADALAREVVEPGTPGLAAVVRRFGPGMLTPEGTLNRAAMGQLVFADPDARRELEAIIHPAVRARAADLDAQQSPEAVVVHVIPLLVETGQQRNFDQVVVVDAPPDAQLARLMARNGLTRAEAQARVAAQATRDQRVAVADVVIRNDGTLDDLRRQVAAFYASVVTSTGA